MEKIKIYTVTCTKSYEMAGQGTFLSLRPWSGDTAYFEGYDDGGKDYILPTGYRLMINKYDDIFLIDVFNMPVDLELKDDEVYLQDNFFGKIKLEEAK